jgi:hypothetical protein
MMISAEKRTLLVLIATAVLIKIFLTFQFTNWNFMNNDEHISWLIAKNYIAGHGYTLNHTEVNWNPTNREWVQTAFRSPFYVFMYTAIQKANITISKWVIFIFAVSCLVYAISGAHIYLLAQKAGLADLSIAAAALYLFYPSSLIYVGALFL